MFFVNIIVIMLYNFICNSMVEQINAKVNFAPFFHVFWRNTRRYNIDSELDDNLSGLRTIRFELSANSDIKALDILLKYSIIKGDNNENIDARIWQKGVTYVYDIQRICSLAGRRT